MASTVVREGGRRTAIAFAAMLAGCALDSPPKLPELQHDAFTNAKIPAAWTASGANGEQVRDRWLAGFDDSQLLQLVAEAHAHNADLRAAAARVEQSAGYVKVAGGKLYPAVNLLGRGTAKEDTEFNGAFVSAAWELDVWGRVRYGVRAAEDQYASVTADYEYARQSMAAMVAKAWFLATEARLQREIATDTLASAERLVGLAEERQRVGVGSELDVVLGRTQVQTLRDSARQIDLAYEQSLRALELLIGRYPAAEIVAAPRLAGMPALVPAGLPSELLERRPDVIAAERRVAAAFNRAKEAKAAMLPRISLTASLSHISGSLIVLNSHANPIWSVGTSLLAPLYQGGALQAQVEVRTAEQKEAVAAYAQIGLKAFGEVENALSSGFALGEREAILDQAVQGAQRALELELIRYRVGSSDLRSATQQQLALYANRVSLLRVQSEQRVQRVNLYLALGGNFGDKSKVYSVPDEAAGNPKP